MADTPDASNPHSNPLSHEELKKLYMQKMLAVEKKDTAFLAELQLQHPELFDKQFLYKMLKTELENHSAELPEHLDQLLQEAIKNVPTLN